MYKCINVYIINHKYLAKVKEHAIMASAAKLKICILKDFLILDASFGTTRAQFENILTTR